MANRKDNKGRVLKDGERQRKNGTYEFRWEENDKRKSVYAPTLKELREKESTIQRDTLDGIQTDGRTMTLNDMYERWLPLKTNLAESTYVNYKYMYESNVRHSLGKRKIANIKPTDIKKFYISLRDDGFAYSTIDNMHTVLYQIFKLALKDDYIRKNPCEDIMREIKQSADYEKPKGISLTTAERDAFMDFVANSRCYKHWHPIFTIFLYTGIRIGELAALRPENIDFDNGYINITHSLSYRKKKVGKCGYIYGPTKTPTSERYIPMLPNVKQAFLDIQKMQADKNLKCKMSINGFDDFVILNKNGNPVHQRLFNLAIARISDKYNKEAEKAAKEKGEEFLPLPKFTCHSFRHTFATEYYASTNDIKSLQTVLGHSDIETTMNIYVDSQKKAILASFSKFAEKQNIK
ncbi:MAG: site-specific integrase [Ruminococcaceae bacterium]|nr:site-specific integrase [Oscillospiraceae bacterium]